MKLVQCLPFAWCMFWLVATGYAPLRAESQPGFADFEKRVGEYLKLHKKLHGELPPMKLTHSQAEILEHQRELARRIREARAQAAPGEIFSPEIAAEFRRLIAITMQGTEGTRIHKSLKRSEPIRIPLRVNDTYPERLPLQTTPPTLLLDLPKLSEKLDYRIVGNNLVLRDVEANLIVDFLPQAIP
jgi:hypothetical protein